MSSSLSPLKVDSGVISDRDVNITATSAKPNSSHPNAISTIYGVANGSSFRPEQSDVLQARLTVSVLCFLLSAAALLQSELVCVSQPACQPDIRYSEIWI